MDDGTYSTKFSVGNFFPIDLGNQGKKYAQIVAFDADEKSDGSGKAKVSIVLRELLITSQKMSNSSSTTGGWAATSLRSYLNETIDPLIPSDIANRIVTVNKTYKDYINGEQTSIDKLWIPSDHEIFDSTARETNGPVYNSVFKNADSRTKRTSDSGDSVQKWWLRSAYSAAKFCIVGNGGYSNNENPGNYCFIALGFCLD